MHSLGSSSKGGDEMRLIRGLAALLALISGLVGIPLALVLLAGNPLPAHPSWRAAIEALLRPDDGSILIALITLVAWTAWAVFAVSLLTELVSLVSGFRVRISIPGLAGPQRFAAGLLLAVVALVAVPVTSVHAAPIVTTPTATSASATSSTGEPVSVSTPPPSRASASPVRQDPSSGQDGHDPALQRTATMAESGSTPHVHVVERGDDLWSLAEHYYGQGRDWRKIAAANPHRLSGGPDRLQPGWRLSIPDNTSGGQHLGDSSVVVRPGDSLSSIAEKAYGQQSRWSDIFDANRDQINDADEIEVGISLALPKAEDAGVPPREGPERQTRTTADSAHSPESKRRAVHPTTETTKESEQPVPTVAPVDPADRADRADPAPTQPAGPTSTSNPTEVEQTSRTPGTAQPADAAPSSDEAAAAVPALDIALGVGSIGGLLAAGVVGGLALRRRRQLQSRPVGRRIKHPEPPAQAVETALAQRQQPINLQTLDLAIRAIAAHCLQESMPLPSLTTATVGPEQIELLMASPAPSAPVGFQVAGRRWLVGPNDAHYLSTVPGVAESVRPYPALTSIGRDEEGRQVLVDLEGIGLLALETENPPDSEALLAGMAVELSFSLWADEMILTLVGTVAGLPEALGRHNVTQCDDLDELLNRLERRAAVQRAHQSTGLLGRHRVDPDLADPWAPEIVLINRPLSAEQERRLVSVVTSEPRVTTAAVVAVPIHDAHWSLRLGRDGDEAGVPTVRGVLQPLGIDVVPQLLEAPAQRAMVELAAVTGSDQTTAAPWWDHTGDPPEVPPPDNVTHLGKRFGGWGSSDDRRAGSQDTSGDRGAQRAEGLDTVAENATGPGPVQHGPILGLLGPVELLGARGVLPPRAAKQCLEYCGWLLEHPGTTALAMAAALVVAEGTRRSNMSRLRTWLGTDAAGEAYLPDAYSGRIFLHPSVSSDWQRLQILTAAGVNKTSSGGLRAALELVRGAPLADAAPGQWCWAEELRTDMVSVVRDIGLELSARALAEHDIDLARWAAARALVAAPGDELLMAARIRTEHQAGNAAETERLTLQLAGQARSLGVDLDQDTVVLLQEVMEGRPRAQMA